MSRDHGISWHAMRRAHVLGFVVLAALCLAGMLVPSVEAKRTARVTLVGDSVAAAISYVPTAQAELARGLRLRLDLKVCRRLVQVSCPYHGSIASTALDAVRRYGRKLGAVLVVAVGYNESARGYGDGVDRVMRAARAQGAEGVVWVTLRETSEVYRRTNAEIRAAANRWPELVVADWDAYSSGKPWFRKDGPHLTTAGATALATFLRPYVLRAASKHA